MRALPKAVQTLAAKAREKEAKIVSVLTNATFHKCHEENYKNNLYPVSVKGTEFKIHCNLTGSQQFLFNKYINIKRCLVYKNTTCLRIGTSFPPMHNSNSTFKLKYIFISKVNKLH